MIPFLQLLFGGKNSIVCGCSVPHLLQGIVVVCWSMTRTSRIALWLKPGELVLPQASSTLHEEAGEEAGASSVEREEASGRVEEVVSS